MRTKTKEKSRGKASRILYAETISKKQMDERLQEARSGGFTDAISLEFYFFLDKATVDNYQLFCEMFKDAVENGEFDKLLEEIEEMDFDTTYNLDKLIAMLKRGNFEFTEYIEMMEAYSKIRKREVREYHERVEHQKKMEAEEQELKATRKEIKAYIKS